MIDFSSDFFAFAAIGFAAQLIDGALGMAYGVITSTVLLSIGQPPAVVSASVHSAEMVVTAFSSASHIYFKNVNWKLCAPLALFGAIGGVIGATILVNIDGDAIKPFISGYLLLLGLFILWRARYVRQAPPNILPVSALSGIGLAGGLLDSIGGGGWGPIVTSNLIARGDNARMVIGSVNTSEFIVTSAVTLAFITTLGFHFTEVVVGLLLGGVLAAPLGALLVKVIPNRVLMLVVGCIIVALSAWQIAKLFS